jgi:hypothetical protein
VGAAALAGALGACAAISGLTAYRSGDCPRGCDGGVDGMSSEAGGGPGSDAEIGSGTDGGDAEPDQESGADGQGSCGSGLVACDGGCVDGTSVANCGRCGNACGGGAPVCAAVTGTYSCVAICPPSAPTDCSGTCVNTTSNPSDCMRCGAACPSSVANAHPACVNSACTFACDAGYTLCNGACVDEQGDNSSCGGCGSGFVCAGGATCVAGRCTSGGSDGGAGSDAGVDANGGPSVGLVAFYPFDETSGTTAADASGNNRTATLVGGATFASGLQGNAATMNGSNQYVSLPGGIVNGLGSFSICGWVKLSSAPAWSRIFDLGTGTNAYMFLTPNSSGGTRFSITTGGSGQEQQMNTTAQPTGNWQHVAVTLAANTGTLYVNGVQVAQDTSMTLNPASLGSTTQNWLGRSQFSADPYLNGQIDNVRIYNRALSSAEVQTLYAGHL